ncbi:hypothetical protein BCR35DRAFT_296442 [Leucosporidium creatinivorum]|uniref:non-specific serine/threonine protein kinase n=1 Tax=Leucosporidium creatinivorum TaxID=106004 RepID=A0A1Y2D8P4_9BASI|nr:hypothetical protein BCR35DRAFT_296442 [Leucosporidium creatinivorum]
MVEQSTPTVSSSASPPRRPRITSWGSDPFSVPQQSTYGRNFALKCLCKKDLTQELIEVQRGEAVLHRALPDHEYIVRLYGAYETDDWLFLVLEYCPGRDLFYWLLESQQVGSDTMYDHRAVSPSDTAHRPLHLRNRSLDLDEDEDDPHLSRTVTANNPQLDLLDETPPSPSLLSSTTNTSLLSRKRLRLISRMFGQMCQAVQACHEVGIAHRDIKPENFIVVDGRAEGESGSSRVVVKITDWGLGTREEMCEDFDCGSKPYMSFECRNNLSPSYDPRQADIWSLGLVLLNLLYHRNPWADPSLDDPDFAEYVHNPRGFLQNRFEDMTDEVAGFLADKVFCDVLEMENGKLRKRVTAGEFGRWAARLVMMMDENQPRSGALAGLQDHTFELVSDVTKALPAPIIGGTSGVGSSLLSQFAPAPPPASIPPPWTPNLLDDLPRDLRETLPSVREEGNDRTYLTNPSTPFAFSDDESLPSPSFSPPVLPAQLPGSPPGLAHVSPAKTRLPWDTPPSPSPAPPEHSETSSHLAESLVTPTIPSEASSSGPPPGLPPPVSLADAAPSSPTSPARPSLVDRQESSQLSTISATTTGSELSNGDDVEQRAEGELPSERKEGEEGEHSSSKSKRRKRGARKSKSSRSKGGENSPPIPSPLVPGSPIGFTILEESPQDQLLQDLASASQNLARELSKTPRSYSSNHSTRNSSHSRPVPIGTQSTSALRSAVSTTSLADPFKKPAKSGGVFGRFKNLVADGNPDLEAFKQRAAERNASIGAASAPAKMEGRKKIDTPLSSRGSIGTASWGSGWSGVDGGDEAPRGRAGGEMSPGHWSSTSSRRERLDKQRRRPGEGDFSPASSTRNGTTNTISTSTLDSRNHTPLSSFSSVASTDPSSLSHSAGAGPHSSANTVRDWRQTSRERGAFSSRHARGHSDSRHRASPPSSTSSHSHAILAPSLPIGSGGKPKLVDVAVDTMDLGLPAPNSPAPSTTSTLSPPPPSAPITIGGATHKVLPLKSTTTSRPSSSTTILAESQAIGTTSPPLASVAPAAKTNKLAKMLNSISVFNRTQERETPGSG